MSRAGKGEAWRLSSSRERDDLGIYVISCLSCLMPGHQDNNFVQSLQSFQSILPRPVKLQDIDSFSEWTEIDSSRFLYCIGWVRVPDIMATGCNFNDSQRTYRLLTWLLLNLNYLFLTLSRFIIMRTLDEVCLWNERKTRTWLSVCYT